MTENTSDQFVEDIDKGLDEIDELFNEDGFFKRFSKMIKGFGSPRNSREFKAAKIEAQRLVAPAAAVIIPVVSIALLAVLATGSSSPTHLVDVEYLEPDKVEDLDHDEPPPPEQVFEFDTDMTLDTDVRVNIEAPVTTTSTQPMTAKPSSIDAVQQVKSPVIMRGIYGNRTGGMKGTLMSKFGGDAQTEAAVMAALRWLKKNQRANGSWAKNPQAMTGLALLTFLAHGEKPGSASPEFGETVQKAIEYLIKAQAANGRVGSSYAHCIATYALCEAYGMTMNPNVKEAADKALNVIVSGQNPQGGWRYALLPTDESDTSVMGWCAQALKAGQLANAYYDKEALDVAIKKAIRGFQGNYKKGGGFGYCGPGAGGLSSVGVLCLQLMGQGSSREATSTLELMDSWPPAFYTADAKGIGGSLQYYYYYATQAKFHAGGKRWTSWNSKMKPIYLKELKIQKNAYTDHEGKTHDIGHWENTDGHSDRPVMDTCLAALQLMVYYRNLPTTQASAVRDDSSVTTADAATSTIEMDDIRVDLGNL